MCAIYLAKVRKLSRHVTVGQGGEPAKDGRFSFAGAGRPVKAAPLNGLAAREPEGRPCGGAFFSPLFLRAQEKGLARPNGRFYGVCAVEGGRNCPTSLFQSGFEQPLKCFFARFNACYFERAPVQAGELLFLLVQEK